MRILIQNYSSPMSSEPMYLNQTFASAEGVESMLWSPNNISAFDVFDRFRPDLLVCHHMGITNDIVTYLTSNKNIKVAVNISNIEKDALKILEDLFTQNEINCKVLFSNNYDFVEQEKPEKFKYEKILPCADLYFSPSDVPDFKLDAAIISTKHSEHLSKMEDKYETYHKMKLGVEQDDNFDLNVNVIMLASLYGKYKEMLICDSVDIAFSQVFFDAFLKSEKVSIKLPEDQQHFFTKALAEIFEEEDNENMLENIKDQIKEKHTCVNRAKQLIGAVV